MRVEHIYRYPVKGLTAEALSAVALRPGETLPWDRAFALVQGDAPFDPAQPRWLHPKRCLLNLMVNPSAALLRAAFDPGTGVLSVAASSGKKVAANALTPGGRDKIAAFLTSHLGAEARGRPHFQYVPGHHFADDSEPYVSVIGEASLRDLVQRVGAPRDRLRFRANLYVSGATLNGANAASEALQHGASISSASGTIGLYSTGDTAILHFAAA